MGIVGSEGEAESDDLLLAQTDERCVDSEPEAGHLRRRALVDGRLHFTRKRSGGVWIIGGINAVEPGDQVEKAA